MANRDKANKAAENFVRTTADSYKVFIDHSVALGERNVRFARGLIESAANETRQQAESNRATAERFAERAESQRDALQTLVGQSVDAYMDLLFAPISYTREGLWEAEKATA